MTDSVDPEGTSSRIARSLEWFELEWAFAPLDRSGWEEHARSVAAWIADGRHGTMDWLAETAASRMRPWEGREWARSYLVFLLPTTLASSATAHDEPVVAGYARDRDYHHRANGILERIQTSLEAAFPGLRSHRFCDELALPEVELAVRAGLGWRGRNSLLLNSKGSAYHVAGLLLDLEPGPAPALQPDRCGSCRACLDACPAGALVEPGLLDARRCLSHWNIEDRDTSEGPAAEAARTEIFGCDLCQVACPWNRKVSPAPPPPPGHPRTWEDWNRVCAPGGGFQSLFTKTPLRRAGRHKVRKVLLRTLRNVDPREARVQAGLALMDETHAPLRTWLKEMRGERPIFGSMESPDPVGTAEIAVVGLGTMGANLARNLVSRGIPTAVHDRSADRIRLLADDPSLRRNLSPATDPAGLAAALVRPRRILVSVPAGPAVDEVIESLLPHLSPGDIVMDGGNSRWTDTERRARALAARGIRFLGVGVSGGAEGALHGPSLMAGGDRSAWLEVDPLLSAIAAQAGPEADAPCCAWLGPEAAGHFAKTVHNAIEYADMQILSEAWGLLSGVAGMSHSRAAAVFRRWNEGDLQGYLTSITAEILEAIDPSTGRPLLEVVCDRTGQNGTGAWALEAALELGIAVPTLAEAVFARSLSSDSRARAPSVRALRDISRPSPVADASSFVDALEKAVLSARLCAWAQGFQLLAAMGARSGWDLDLSRTALVWRAGCILRARLLDDAALAFRRDRNLPHLLLDPAFSTRIREALSGWRSVVADSVQQGIPVPAIASALSWVESLRSERLPSSLLQAQRDRFGNHGFERTDLPGKHHHPW
jgi:6-phosphogluconate dehydrogenase